MSFKFESQTIWQSNYEANYAFQSLHPSTFTYAHKFHLLSTYQHQTSTQTHMYQPERCLFFFFIAVAQPVSHC
jgi:hypothetical protein